MRQAVAVRLRVVMALPLVVVLARGAAAQPTCLTDAQCSDGDLCDGIERCVAGTCTPPTAPLACDDGDPCTVDGCDPNAGCSHADVACPSTCGPGDDGLRCSDGTACTVNDTCAGGVCTGTPLACDDGDPCTADACDATFGCVYSEVADPPLCLTSSQCVMAADHTPCVGDGDPCTQDGCLEGFCQIGLNSLVRQCSDGDPCNGDEFCSTVKGCEPGPPPVCDDGDACNGTETCVAPDGCTSGTPLPDGTSCDDGMTCTEGDACAAGTCAGSAIDCADVDPATVDLCLEPTGCLHCAPLAAGRLTLRLPTVAKPGRFTASGRFVPATPFVPNAPAGTDVVIQDGPTVVQSSHVDGTELTTNGAGTTFRFADRSGTLAEGLEKLRVKTAAPGEKHTFSASGRLLASTLAPASSRSLTLRAGSTCATAVLGCTATSGGKSNRCR
jgi:Dictyostelium (slime mold) repeat